MKNLGEMKMKKLFMFALFGLVAVTMTMVPDMALAGAGADFYADLQTALTGNIGTIAGLLIAIFGLYIWLVQQASWGIIMIIGGVLVTIFPQVFDSVSTGTQDALTNTLTP
jgi:hypothetical protein